MNVFEKVLIGAIVVLFIALFASVRIAPAQEIPPQHNMHDPSHWYGFECCNTQDCAPAAQPVRETAEGYFISELGEMVNYRDAKVRDSKDGEFHVCARKNPVKGSRVICLYVPPRSF